MRPLVSGLRPTFPPPRPFHLRSLRCCHCAPPQARVRDELHQVPGLFPHGGEVIGGRPEAGRQRRRLPRFDVTYNGCSVRSRGSW